MEVLILFLVLLIYGSMRLASWHFAIFVEWFGYMNFLLCVLGIIALYCVIKVIRRRKKNMKDKDKTDG